ncbi:thiol-disulfide oxidoreductase DCC family protein [bacterium]|nr:thiol-disulfide oxidoreductase DCC family protein [bacterium]
MPHTEEPSTKTPQNGVVLFDGVCNFCNSSINFVMDRDPSCFFKFGALQSEEGILLLKNAGYQSEYLDSVLLLQDGHVYRDSEAALRITRKMTGLWPLMFGFIIIPRVIRDAVYNWIARNRYRWFGKMDSCRMPTPEIRSRFI